MGATMPAGMNYPTATMFNQEPYYPNSSYQYNNMDPMMGGQGYDMYPFGGYGMQQPFMHPPQHSPGYVGGRPMMHHGHRPGGFPQRPFPRMPMRHFG